MAPNILLVVLDSVRAQSTSLHGYHRDTTPFFSEFSSQATIFYQARAPSVASLPSHVSMFTGYHTAEHGLGNDAHHRGVRLSEGVTIWEELAADHGYTTGLFSDNPYLTGVPVGFQDAFDTVAEQTEPPFSDAVDPRSYYDGKIDHSDWIHDCIRSGKPLQSIINGISLKFSQPDNSVYGFPEKLEPKGYADTFLDWIDNNSDRPWAACVNLMDAHTPYVPAKKYDEWGTAKDWSVQKEISDFRWEFVSGQRPLDELENLKNLYDGSIRQADAKEKKIITGLRRRGVLDNTLVVITSDHGEGFGEPSNIRPNQNVVGHTLGGHESQLHVPLIVHVPGFQEGKEEISQLASLTRFPSVVRKTIDRDDSPAREFVSEVALATQLGLSDEDVDAAASYGIDSGPITGDIRIAYEHSNGSVYKYASWKDRQLSFRGSSVNEVENFDEYEKMNEFYRDVDYVNISKRKPKNIDTEVKNRLEKFGYI